MKRNVCSLVCPIIGILIGIGFILVGISLKITSEMLVWDRSALTLP